MKCSSMYFFAIMLHSQHYWIYYASEFPEFNFLTRKYRFSHDDDANNVRYLLNPEVYLNVSFSDFSLNLEGLFEYPSIEKANHFLENDKLDWLAPTCDRNLVALDDKGIQYERGGTLDSQNSLQKAADYFYHLPKRLLRKCPEHSKLIYIRIIEQIVELAEAKGESLPETKEALLFKTVTEISSFQAAVKFCTDVNIRDVKGRTLLHCTLDCKVIRLLLGLGADLDAVDKEGMTPLMAMTKNCFWSGAKLLIKSGANSEFINSKGKSFFSVCPEKFQFLEHFPLSEKIFISELQQGRAFDRDDELFQIFQKYPRYKNIFEADLPNNLPAIAEWSSSRFLITVKHEEYLQCWVNSLKNQRIRNFSDLVTARNPLDFSARVIEAGREDVLVRLIKANILKSSAMVKGQTLLFSARKQSTISFLFDRNVDGKVKSDGFLFFERQDFLKNCQLIKGKWLIQLSRQGLDLFSRKTKTGKSLVEWLPQNAQIDFDLDQCRFQFPVAKLTKSGFQGILCNGIVDDEGSTALNYAHVSDLKNPSIADLKRISGNYEILLEKDEFFYLGRKFRGQEFKIYLCDYVEVHGQDWIKHFGGQLLLKALEDAHFDLALYLLEYGKVSLTRIIGKAILFEFIINNRCRISAQTAEFLMNHVFKEISSFSKKVQRAIFWYFIKNRFHEALKHLLDSCSEEAIVEFAESICFHLSNYSHFSQWGGSRNDSWSHCPREFFLHSRVRSAVLEKNGKTCNLLDHLYFKICSSKERIDFFHCELGVDARNTIGSGIAVALPNRNDVNEEDYWELFRNYGWKMEDFKKFPEFKSSIISSNEAFLEIFPYHGEIFASINRDEVIGECVICSICRDEFTSDDNVRILSCQHIFHFDCIKRFFKRNHHCPYCRKLS